MSGRTAFEMDPTEWKRYHPFQVRKPAVGEAENAAEARILAEKLALELRHRFSAKKVVLFGSLARLEFSGHSDIDLAVWGIPPWQFYRAVAFVSGLSKDWKVDLIDGEDCPESLKKNIEQEGVEL